MLKENQGINTPETQKNSYQDEQLDQLFKLFGCSDESTDYSIKLYLLEVIEELKKLPDILKKVNLSTKKEFFQSWLSNDEILRFLKISPRTLQTLRTNGKLPFTRIENKIYYKREDVVKLLNANYNGTPKD